ncbi:LysR family transcriptional regulator [Rhodobacteraceae bacterium F11138]|nr:LysR family transcriptional regulator [Rhodobacteraceae bacterium F11138]
MDDAPPHTDWSLIQSFLAVAETGSLSAAARKLGRSQPTLGRQIRTLEKHLGADLFLRHPRGLRPSKTGSALLPIAQRMQAEMHALSLTAAGQSQRLQGTVRITASVFASHHLLPPILARIRAAEPRIQLDLIPSDTTENLLFREADIAVRMYRPTQLDIVTQHITDLELGIFAAHSYLERAGRPKSARDLREHDLIGYDRNDLILRTTQALGWPLTRDHFAVRCDDQAAYWDLLRAGCGIGFSQVNVGRADPLVQELKLGVSIPPLPVWLAAHPMMRQTPRLRRVWDMLSSGLAHHAVGSTH